MFKLIVVAAVTLSVLFGSAVAAETQKVTLNLYGVVCPGCAKELTDALVQGGVENVSAIRPNKGEGPVVVMGELAEDGDLGALAKTVNTAATPHRDQSAPGVALVLFAKLDGQSAQTAVKAISEIKGVDAKGSKADPKKGEISVKIAGDEKLTVPALLAALNRAGIEASVIKTT
jgi:copper chaperone CopZ